MKTLFSALLTALGIYTVLCSFSWLFWPLWIVNGVVVGICVVGGGGYLVARKLFNNI